MTTVGTVRDATPADAVLIHLIAAATFPLACPGIPADDVRAFIDEHLTVERFKEALREPTARLFVAEVDGTPAGYAMVDLAPAADAEVTALLTRSPAVELVKLYLLAGRHGSGLADSLMRAVIAVAREHGAAGIWLGVHDANDRPNRFYDRHHFARRGTTTFTVGATVARDLIRERVL